MSIHNHGTNLPPSGSDFGAAGYRRYAFGVVACHDGKVYRYSAKNARAFSHWALDSKIAKYKMTHPGVSDIKAAEKILDEFALGYDIEWRELK